VPPPNLHITQGVGAISFTPRVRRVPCSVHPWPSSGESVHQIRVRAHHRRKSALVLSLLYLSHPTLAARVSTSRSCRFCCKSLKTPGDKFPARRQNKPRSLVDVASGSLARSPVSLSPGDEVPHMFTRKPHLQLEKFAVNGAKRLLQQNPGDIPCRGRGFSFCCKEATLKLRRAVPDR
jgi:hypothetical protein